MFWSITKTKTKSMFSQYQLSLLIYLCTAAPSGNTIVHIGSSQSVIDVEQYALWNIVSLSSYNPNRFADLMEYVIICNQYDVSLIGQNQSVFQCILRDFSAQDMSGC